MIVFFPVRCQRRTGLHDMNAKESGMCPGDWFPLGLQTRALGWIRSKVGCCMVSIIFDELKHLTLKSGFLDFLEKARLKSSFSAQQYAADGQLRPCEVAKAVHCAKAPGRQGKWRLNPDQAVCPIEAL